MTLTVLVPEEEGLMALTGLGNVNPVLYNPAGRMPEQASYAQVMVVPPLHADRLVAAMREMPRLRLVQTLSAGIDRWQGRLPPGVLLSNARGAHGGATAEWAVTVLLSIFRRIPRWVADQEAHAWRPRTTETLEGKRILILGAGDLGANLRARLEPFGALVTMAARTPRPGVHGQADVPRLLGEHDAVVVMVPYSSETHHLVDKGFLSRMPDGAVLVNAARGPVVDTGALLDELNAERLRAALDVTDPEPLPPGHPLWDAPGVLITPHIGGNTTGFAERAWAVAASQIAAFAAGRRPPNAIGR
jgi:phosphoglycerate dehydrogenase-like enzyme